MNSIKEKTIAAAMEEREKIYLHAAPHENLVIGRRGLVGNEQTNGIVLSISAASAVNFHFEETGLSVQLRFAGVWEDVFIPFDAIDAVLDDLAAPSFVFNFPKLQGEKIQTGPKPIAEEKRKAEIIKPDFNRKKP